MAPMNKTTGNAQQKILDAAQKLIMSKGFHGVSVDQIISDAGVSKGSFFYHFSSKDELPAAMLQRFIDQQGSDILHTIEQQADVKNPLDRACGVVDGLVDVFRGSNQKAPGCMMGAFSYQLVAELADVQSISQAAVQGWNHAIGALFDELCRQTPKSPPPEQLAEQLLCCLQGAFILARINADVSVIVRAGETYKNYLHTLFSPD